MNVDWIPEEHLDVAATLAHVDEVISLIGKILFDYQTSAHGILKLREENDGEQRYLVVDAIAPVPPKIALLAADALNGLRAALEHTIFIEATLSAGAPLDKRAARLVEMPAAHTHDKFVEWTNRQAKNGPAALRSGAALNSRIYELQPLHRHQDPAAHPLARLVAYTNHAKHRRPAVTAVRLPIVEREDVPPRHSRDLPRRPEAAIAVGEVVFTAPTDQVVPLTLFPTVGINIPDTTRWPVLIRELDELASWVRKHAIPRLITGTSLQGAQIPASYDISSSHEDHRAAIAEGTNVTAFQRNVERLQAANIRQDIPRTIAAMPGAPALVDVIAWVKSLPDAELLRRMSELIPSFDSHHDVTLHNWKALQRMCNDATVFANRKP